MMEFVLLWNCRCFLPFAFPYSTLSHHGREIPEVFRKEIYHNLMTTALTLTAKGDGVIGLKPPEWLLNEYCGDITLPR